MASAMLLIDADLLLHRTTAVTERDIDWGDGVSTIHCDHAEMQVLAKREIAKIIAGCGLPHVKIVLVFSGPNNFRKELDPSYKANRAGSRKPVGYSVLKDWLFKNYDCKVHPRIEADDLMGIMQTSGKLGKTMIVSDDKDMHQIPGLLYRPSEGVVKEISVNEAYRYHMLQTLCGDKADNYPGLPGCGEKKTEVILDCSPDDYWGSVVEAFEKAGLTYEDALLQARLSKILHVKDYDLKNRKPILWTPQIPKKKSVTIASSESTTPAPTKTSSETASKPTSTVSKSPALTRTKRTKKQSTSPTTTPSTK